MLISQPTTSSWAFIVPDESSASEISVIDLLPEFNRPSYYEFRVDRRLSPQSASWFEGMDITVDEAHTPVQTIIQGYMEDQAALHGLISRIRDLGLTLVSVNRIE